MLVIPNANIPTIIAIVINATNNGLANPKRSLTIVAKAQPTMLNSEDQTRTPPTQFSSMPAFKLANSIYVQYAPIFIYVKK